MPNLGLIPPATLSGAIPGHRTGLSRTRAARPLGRTPLEHNREPSAIPRAWWAVRCPSTGLPCPESLCQQDGWLLCVSCHQTGTLFLSLARPQRSVCNLMSFCCPCPGNLLRGAQGGSARFGDGCRQRHRLDPRTAGKSQQAEPGNLCQSSPDAAVPPPRAGWGPLRA